ncbi:MAG: hypothetical protein EHM81_00540 [Chloroflexi bacterium]|nr:MAG: hypothetical protein EHM81_00540 [Chloroflexota bacterium]
MNPVKFPENFTRGATTAFASPAQFTATLARLKSLGISMPLVLPTQRSHNSLHSLASREGFKSTRKFRGSLYRICVHKENGVSKGVARMTVDGQEIAGNLIPLHYVSGTFPLMNGREHIVEVWLG